MLPFELVEKISITMSTPDLVKFSKTNKHYNYMVKAVIKKRHDIKQYIAQYVNDVDGLIELCYKYEICIVGHPIYQAIYGQPTNTDQTMYLFTLCDGYDKRDAIEEFLKRELYMERIDYFERNDRIINIKYIFEEPQIIIEHISIFNHRYDGNLFKLYDCNLSRLYDCNLSRLCYWNCTNGYCYGYKPGILLFKKLIFHKELHEYNKIVNMDRIMTTVDPLKYTPNDLKPLVGELISYIEQGFSIEIIKPEFFTKPLEYTRVDWITKTADRIPLAYHRQPRITD
jgi:hypothetical protein